ncbi:unnamed protein product [marine sediment metagenome]|uniref:Outer membrane protein beta-barrel domain-containing protein n=1 Tax=marine sediment metagenome TaxID=412755 RepID=X1V242_9ZZZZ
MTTTAFANDKLALKASIGYARWIPVTGGSADKNRGGRCLLGKFLFYNLSPTTSIGIESGFFFWGRAKGEIEGGGSWEEIKTSIPFFLIVHFKIAGNEEKLSYYLDLGVGVQGAPRKGYIWSNEYMGFLITPGIELYLSPALKLDIFVEIQSLSDFAFGGTDEGLTLIIPSVGIRF